MKKGYITKVGENLRRTKYYITPEGIREKVTLAYKSFGRNIQYFSEIRKDIESQIGNGWERNQYRYLWY